MLTIREGKPEDFRAYLGGHEFPREWCCDDPIGLVADDDGKIVALWMTTKDDKGQTWAWFDSRVKLSPATTHRAAVMVLDWLKARGTDEIHAFCNEQVPTSANWLSHLGFRPKGRMPHPVPGVERTAWVRTLN